MIRIGSIGLGGISHAVHIPGIQACSDFKLTALCDIDEAVLKARAEEYGIAPEHCYTDYRDLINDPEVDAIDISTPNDCHAEIAEYAAKAGKPFDVEKPITLNQEEAAHLLQVTKESGVANMLCFSYRYKAAARYARDLIREGKLGRIYHVNTQYYQAWGLPIANCARVWRYDKSRSGSGALGDLGCHVLDLAAFVTGEKYKKVFAHNTTFTNARPLPGTDEMAPVDVDDHCDMLLESESGTSFAFEISRFTFARGNYQRMEIYGDYGVLIYTLDATPDVDELEFCDNNQEKTFVKLEIPEKYRVSQMQGLADLINGCADGLSATVQDGYENQVLLDAVLKSADEGRWIDL